MTFKSQSSHNTCLEKSVYPIFYSRGNFPWNMKNEKRLRSVDLGFTGLWGSESCSDVNKADTTN